MNIRFTYENKKCLVYSGQNFEYKKELKDTSVLFTVLHSVLPELSERDYSGIGNLKKLFRVLETEMMPDDESDNESEDEDTKEKTTTSQPSQNRIQAQKSNASIRGRKVTPKTTKPVMIKKNTNDNDNDNSTESDDS